MAQVCTKRSFTCVPPIWHNIDPRQPVPTFPSTLINMTPDLLSRLRRDFGDARRGEIEAIADRMGVPRGTLRRIVSGRTPDPRYSTVQRIAAYYEDADTELPSSSRPVGR
jgi:hypothetical protein